MDFFRRRPPNWPHAWLLAALLLAVQALGLVHHVQHAPGLVAPAAAAPAYAAAQGHGQADQDHRQLHGHDPGGAECRLVDQLGHVEVALADMGSPALPPGGAAAPPCAATPVACAAPAAAYQARGPPAAPLTFLA